MSTSGPRGFRDALHILELDQARWEAVLDSARDAIIGIDTSGVVTLFNRSAQEIFGYDAAEVLGQNVTMLMPAPYSDEHDRYLQNYHETKVRKAIGYVRYVEARRKTGEVFPIELSVSEARVGDGVLYTAIIRDVTERKQAEEALQHERDFARRVVETAQTIILVRDLDGRVVLCNPYLERISGFPISEIQGKDWFSHFVPPSQQARVKEIFSEVLRQGSTTHYVSSLVTKAGPTREIEWHSVALRDAHGAVSGTLAAGQDITDRLRTEAELAEMRKLDEKRERLADIGAITAKIAHDLGNPLSGLSMQAQLILQRARRDGSQPLETILKPAEQLVSEVRRLGDLIREFLSFAREQRLDLAPIELAPFLTEVLDLWRPVAEHQGIRLEGDGARAVDRIEADRGKLRRVLDNLVKNAVEAIGAGPGEVRIVTSLAGSEKLRISVEDSGCGIPDHVQVFRLFETTKKDGSGLGLAVSKQILLAHGGDLLFSARSPRGTAFHVELPLRRTTP